MKRDTVDIIRNPMLTEKAYQLKEASNQYMFEVSKSANKPEIKRAVEELYKVTVLDVRVINLKGKIRRVRRAPGRTRSRKKALVRLKPGDSIPTFEGGGA
jgi:large subunit ribosomal protein L23